MNYDVYCEQPTFHTIGMLREILKNYPNSTVLKVSGTLGTVYFNERQNTIDLIPFKSSKSNTIWNSQYPATEPVEYMDF